MERSGRGSPAKMGCCRSICVEGLNQWKGHWWGRRFAIRPRPMQCPTRANTTRSKTHSSVAYRIHAIVITTSSATAPRIV